MAFGELHKLKEIRRFLAIIVADNETLCTQICCGFPQTALSSRESLNRRTKSPRVF